METTANIKQEFDLYPHPDILLKEAEEETDKLVVDSYYSVMVTLRQKGFSFREIAEWLTERGVEVDHNAVYRCFTSNMSEDEAQNEAIADAEDSGALQSISVQAASPALVTASAVPVTLSPQKKARGGKKRKK